MPTHWFADPAVYEERLQQEVAELRLRRDAVKAQKERAIGGVLRSIEVPAPVSAVPVLPATASPSRQETAQNLPPRVVSMSVNDKEVQSDAALAKEDKAVVFQGQASTHDTLEEGELLDTPSSPDEPLIRRRSSDKTGETIPPPAPLAVTKSPISAIPSTVSEDKSASKAVTTSASSTSTSTASSKAPLSFKKIPKFSDSASVKPAAGTKRKAEVTSTDINKRRSSTSGSPPITSPATGTGSRIDSLPLPSWYIGQQVVSRDLKQAHVTTLLRIKDFIRDLDIKQRKGEDLSETFDKIRTQLHDLEHSTTDAMHIKRSKLLESEALPKLFHNMTVPIPFDIIADAKALHRKWCRQDFDADPFRGIILAGTKNANARRSTSPSSNDGTGNGTRLDKNYPNRVNASYFGTGDLVSGQWWPIQLMALRDGAHNSSQAGISGKRGEGAYSVTVAGVYAEDIDNGDTIQYCGTKDLKSTGTMTEDTKLLFANIRNKHPVRVIRSGEKKENKSIYKPDSGYRYDGVYDVVDSELLNKEQAHYRFTLKRQPGQDPIRYQGLYARPSAQDQAAYRKVKELTRGGV